MSKRQISPSPDQIPRDIFSNESDMGGPNRTDSPNTRSMLSYTARLVGKPEIYHKAVYPPQNSKRREKSRNKQRTKKALTKILKKSKADAKTKELIKIEIQKMLRNESAPKDIHNPDDLFSLKELEEDEEELKQTIADEQGIDTDVDGWEDEVENFIEEKRQELLSEWLQEKLEELQAISFE